MLTRQDMIGPWAGLPVAWDEKLNFDEQTYRADLERTCKAGVPGVYTAGTTGEFYAMELDEWKQITRVTVEECKKYDTPVMIGITSTYTLGAPRRVRRRNRRRCGADRPALLDGTGRPSGGRIFRRHRRALCRTGADHLRNLADQKGPERRTAPELSLIHI